MAPSPPNGPGHLIPLLVPLIVATGIVIFGLVMLGWNLFTDPSSLPWYAWVAIACFVAYAMVTLLTKLGQRRGGRLGRVMSSTKNTKFYERGTGVALFFFALSMIFESDLLFFIGIAIALATLLVDLALRLAFEHDVDRAKRDGSNQQSGGP